MKSLVHRQEALRELTGSYGLTHPQAIRALAIADQHGKNMEGCGNRVVTITAKHNGKEQYELDDGLTAFPAARSTGTGYNQSEGKNPKHRKGKEMPRTAAAKPATEETNGAVDYTVYADKPITPGMQDFHDWLTDNVGDLSKMDTVRIVALAGTLRMEFQQSDFNKERRAERRAAREAPSENGSAPAEDEKPAKPGRRAGGTTGRRAGSAAPANEKPARRGRGRAAATAEAPF